MKNLKKHLLLAVVALALVSCNDDDMPVANDVTLQFNNTFSGETIVLGNATSTSATVNTSVEGQTHHFSELKYVISNIRLIKADGTEIPYHVNNLDNGATMVDQAKSETLQYVLNDIPTAEYSQIKFGLGVKSDLNTLDQVSFPEFYAAAGANDTQMHWEWGTGYRFTKIEGFYNEENNELSFHSGSTVEGEVDDESSYVPGFDAYRDITLNLPTNAVVGEHAPTIHIEADFDNLLSGKTNTIILSDTNATPSAHTSVTMSEYVDNIGGNGTSDITGMFSIQNVEN
ncbi:MbnP family protein [Formosa haliotis]|uniref:MbnP family protein n=1 Tax=Formosa haliotis TaxID=1555194 RepID=UPI000825541A|nr:MbnP family protein [Formosa haliotis]